MADCLLQNRINEDNLAVIGCPVVSWAHMNDRTVLIVFMNVYDWFLLAAAPARYQLDARSIMHALPLLYLEAARVQEEIPYNCQPSQTTLAYWKSV